MKSIVLFLLSFVCAQAAVTQAPLVLTVYTYSTITSKGGLGEVLFPSFEKKCKCKVVVQSFGDAGRLMNQIQLETRDAKVKAQIALGVDHLQWENAKKFAEVWETWTPNGYKELENFTKLGQGFLAFDYGVLTWMVNEAALKKTGLPEPKSWDELLSEKYRRMFLIQDPRASSPGLQLMLMSDELKKDSFSDFWKKFRPNWLTLASSWDDSYGLFLKGEAPFVWSYVTSEAYHRNENEKGYHALGLKEGGPLQIEGAFMILGGVGDPKMKKLAQDFLSHLISVEVQKEVPGRNWMNPARKKTPLPKSFSQLPKVEGKLIRRSPDRIKEITKTWEKAIR